MSNDTKQTAATERRERPLKVHHLRPGPGRQDRPDPGGSW